MNPKNPEPWTIPAAAWDAMVRRAESDFPEETCGLVFGEGDSLEVLPLQNIQNDLHAADPALHTRDARTAYAFDPRELEAAISSREFPPGQTQGAAPARPLRSIYHSHPDHDAYFSATDRRAAAPPEWGGEPTYPGVVYLVFSVYSGKLRAVAAFSWSESARDFIEVPVSRGR